MGGQTPSGLSQFPPNLSDTTCCAGLLDPRTKRAVSIFFNSELGAKSILVQDKMTAMKPGELYATRFCSRELTMECVVESGVPYDLSKIYLLGATTEYR